MSHVTFKESTRAAFKFTGHKLEEETKLLRTIFEKSTYKKITEVYVDHEENNSSTPEENTNNSSLSPTIENINLNKLLLDLGIKQGDSDESTWENINTRLHMIFGHTNQLKTPINDNDKDKYLQLIHALKHSKFMNKFPVDTWVNKAENTFGQVDLLERHDVNDASKKDGDDQDKKNIINKKTCSDGFTKWNEIENLAKRVSEEVTHFRLNHFLKLIDGYLALFKFAGQETPEEYKNYNDDQKIENGIALGRDKSSHLKLKWVKFQIRKFLGMGIRNENKKYIALWRIKFIVDNKIKTTKELAKA
ncbi:hypothetical protein C2G38_2051724, partial [Gigaspora rosea]